jgi:hypothetical protein
MNTLKPSAEAFANNINAAQDLVAVIANHINATAETISNERNWTDAGDSRRLLDLLEQVARLCKN